MPAEVEYRDLVDWPGYRVGSDGTVWSRLKPGVGVIGDEWRQLRQRLDKYGYPRVNIYRDHVMFVRTVHQLVLGAFFSRPPSSECRHLDGDSTNNRIENLRWGSVSDNAIDRVVHGTCPLLRKGIDHPQGKITDEEVVEIVDAARSGTSTCAELADRFGISEKYVLQLKRLGGRDQRKRKRA